MKVLKFGGTSVGTIESLRNVKLIVEGIGEPAIVVVSALGGLTDNLIATAHLAADGNTEFKENVELISDRHFKIIDALVLPDCRNDVRRKISELLSQLSDIYMGISLIRDLPERTLNQIVSFGERMSSIIVANILRDARHADSLSFIKTEKWFDKNIADRELTEKLICETFALPLSQTYVCGGFISRDKDTNEITNLGRGGSDYTAALIAAALNADLLEIWTDVDGFMTSDPRIIKDARVIDKMSFVESMELCSYGAKVVYPPTIYPVFHKNITIKILNTHNPQASGTLITDGSKCTAGSVRGVSSVKNLAMLEISGELAANTAEINSRTYNAMARNGINVFLVSQPQNASAFSIALNSKDAPKGESVLRDEFAPELQNGTLSSITIRDNLAIIAIVGEQIKRLNGLATKIVEMLEHNNIKVYGVSDGASETTITIVVDDLEADTTLRKIHAACFN